MSTGSACDGERGMNVTAFVGSINVTSSPGLHKHMVSSHLNQQLITFAQLLPHCALQQLSEHLSSGNGTFPGNLMTKKNNSAALVGSTSILLAAGP